MYINEVVKSWKRSQSLEDTQYTDTLRLFSPVFNLSLLVKAGIAF